MVIIAWLIIATFMLLGFVSLTVILLPLRIFIWFLRLFFGIF
jgi:hypothetical protein